MTQKYPNNIGYKLHCFSDPYFQDHDLVKYLDNAKVAIKERDFSIMTLDFKGLSIDAVDSGIFDDGAMFGLFVFYYDYLGIPVFNTSEILFSGEVFTTKFDYAESGITVNLQLRDSGYGRFNSTFAIRDGEESAITKLRDCTNIDKFINILASYAGIQGYSINLSKALSDRLGAIVESDYEDMKHLFYLKDAYAPDYEKTEKRDKKGNVIMNRDGKKAGPVWISKRLAATSNTVPTESEIRDFMTNLNVNKSRSEVTKILNSIIDEQTAASATPVSILNEFCKKIGLSWFVHKGVLMVGDLDLTYNIPATASSEEVYSKICHKVFSFRDAHLKNEGFNIKFPWEDTDDFGVADAFNVSIQTPIVNSEYKRIDNSMAIYEDKKAKEAAGPAYDPVPTRGPNGWLTPAEMELAYRKAIIAKEDEFKKGQLKGDETKINAGGARNSKPDQKAQNFYKVNKQQAIRIGGIPIDLEFYMGSVFRFIGSNLNTAYYVVYEVDYELVQDGFNMSVVGFRRSKSSMTKEAIIEENKKAMKNRSKFDYSKTVKALFDKQYRNSGNPI